MQRIPLPADLVAQPVTLPTPESVAGAHLMGILVGRLLALPHWLPGRFADEGPSEQGPAGQEFGYLTGQTLIPQAPYTLILPGETDPEAGQAEDSPAGRYYHVYGSARVSH